MNCSLANMNGTPLDCNTTEDFYNHQNMLNYSAIIAFSVILIICCIGIPLNGIVIWLLGFHIKRNPFTVLILNLAIADFGFLTVLAILSIYFSITITTTTTTTTLITFGVILDCLSKSLYMNGLFLLAAISIDRCVCVLFPIWHRCSRPKHLSPAVCAFLWISSILFFVILQIMEFKFGYNVLRDFHLFVTAIICLPLITISTLILFIKIYHKPKQIKRGRLFMMILITLLCFLILTLPLHIYVIVIFFFDVSYWRQFPELGIYLSLGSSLNSTVNPVIYYLVGRKERAQTKESIKVIFQRVFKEDETPERTEKATNTVPTPL